ncbi:hypothetical protein LTR50_006282 [Elasticomyces elasticus]|nr:hypothetical protein LTR50_006282 [Elasticomyces elasticus]
MATQHQQTPKDHWSSKAYTAAASFVPKLTSTVLSYLSPQSGDRILDIGCGDGPLTAQIAQTTNPGQVLGLDASPSFISTAQLEHSSPNCSFRVQDCTKLSECADVVDGSWDKVFSNAALHWILRDERTRMAVLRDIHAALKPGGVFVFEQGGKGNVAEIVAALIAALVAHGVPISRAREVNPWFFPSENWMRAALAEAGFEVEKVELEYRPTRCTERTESGDGGLEGWVKFMGAQFLDAVEEGRRDSVVKSVCETLESILTREEDGSVWIGYVRLRAIAWKRR